MVSSIRNAPAATLRRLAHLQRLLEPGNIQPVYQPIVRTTDLEPIGYEGLARFPYADGLSNMPPDVTLAAAAEIGLREDLEVACWAAMAAAGSPPGRRLLFVNISPGALRHPGLFMLADQLPSRLVIEITEQTDIADYTDLRDALAPWVARGAQVAIDDTGAGYASLEHVVELRPDFLKLTRGLVADIDKDANRQALLRALGAFAREVGAVIVAEGVERREELEVLRESQIEFAQGWLFGRPGRPWPEVPEIESRGRRPALSDSAVRRLSSLEQAVAVAVTAHEAAEAAVAHLAHLGLLPSIYLQQGERLRCVASRGYYSLFDGIAPEAGLVGRAYRTGEVVDVADVMEAPGYLRSSGAVKTSRSVPVHAGSRVVGVVCIESSAPIGAEPAMEADRAAEVLGRRLAELGMLDPTSAGQRLARAAARTAAMEDPDAVVREAAAAAMEVSGMESVLIALRDGSGRTHYQHAAGPLADAFSALSASELATVTTWVEPGTTMLSMADATGRGDAVAETLRQAGAGALLVVPLAVGRARLGFLALADRSVMRPDVERTELIELLGVQTAAQLRGLAAVGELRDRASRDPLTGLGHERAFKTRLPRRRRAAAKAGCKVAVLLADFHGVADANERGGHAAGDEILRGMAALLAEIAAPSGEAYRLGGDEFALVVDTPDRTAVQELAWQLQARAREQLGVAVSIGVAVTDGAETDDELRERSHAAVGEVKRRGRDGVVLAPAL
jgi:diguanylate cyclase (GGDEF)-like protein